MQELATGYGLIEGPVWDAAKGLYFSDVLGGGIHLLDREDKVSLAVPKRRGVGGMALHADGGLVAGGRDIVHVSLADHSMKVLLDRKAADNAVGFNDLTTDAKGRIYVGSIAFAIFKGEEMKPGNLYVIDLDGKARKISDGIMLTNGLGFSPDGRRLYHSDPAASSSASTTFVTMVLSATGGPSPPWDLAAFRTVSRSQRTVPSGSPTRTGAGSPCSALTDVTAATSRCRAPW